MKTNKTSKPVRRSSKSPSSQNRLPSKRRWHEGKVDVQRAHFKLLIGDVVRLFNENKHIVDVDEVTAENGFQVIALVGRGRGSTYVVDFVLPDDIDTLTPEWLDRAKYELDFYLGKTNPKAPNPWDYAIAHSHSFSNLYSPIHWQYCPK